MNLFDRKFGADLLSDLPDTPAVYLFKDAHDEVIYVGKAKRIRRRLSNYRNASRRKVHRKMRMIVREAVSLEIRPQPSERDALLLENRLIRELQPLFNEDGTYTFLYPAIGVAISEKQLILCFTTDIKAWKDLDLAWYGVFRSRVRARKAFEALGALLVLAGHREPKKYLPPHPAIRGSRLVGFRRLSPDIGTAVKRFLAGDDRTSLTPLVEHLLDKPQARHDAAQVQAHLKVLSHFHRTDLVPLNTALKSAGKTGHFVGQENRDALFIAAKKD